MAGHQRRWCPKEESCHLIFNYFEQSDNKNYINMGCCHAMKAKDT